MGGRTNRGVDVVYNQKNKLPTRYIFNIMFNVLTYYIPKWEQFAAVILAINFQFLAYSVSQGKL